MYSLKYPIQINTGQTLDDAPAKIEFGEKHYEVLMPVGKDHTVSLYIAESVIKDNPWMFEEE